jgi:LacI family repressor for deo operon, udp, cdd, tsx, nupC, and nupG
MGKITRDDVARLAGVSPATVSNALNNKPFVSERVKKKVLNAVEELHYTPNLVARSLMTRSSSHIALLLDDITNPHFNVMAQGVQELVHEKGWMLSISLATAGNIDDVVSDYLARHVDGIVLNSRRAVVSEKMMGRLRSSGTVCVYCGGVSGPDRFTMNFAYGNGMKKAYSYLLDLGHTDIALLSGLARLEDPAMEDHRTLAFRWSAEHFGGGLAPQWLIYGEAPYPTDMAAGYAAAAELLRSRPLPTAVITINDYMAVGAMKCLKENRIRIPQDISLISFDNTIYAQITTPGLTSISSPARDFGRKAAELVFEARADEHPRYRDIVFDMELVIRESTGHV